MKNRNISLLIGCIICLFTNTYSQEMVFSGAYQGKDLFLMNPMLEYGTEYCISDVKVNDMNYPHTLKTGAFRIQLSEFELDYGEEFTVIIKHEEYCLPTLINPEVLQPLSTYKLIDYELGYDNMLLFTTDNESGKLKFIVEEYRWGQWVKLDEIDGKGGPGRNTYQVKIYPFNGNNVFRIYQTDHLYQRNYSQELSIPYQTERITILSNLRRIRNTIEFSDKTRFFIINQFGEVLLSGYSDTVDVSELRRGEYFVRYDNVYDVFRKR